MNRVLYQLSYAAILLSAGLPVEQHENYNESAVLCQVFFCPGELLLFRPGLRLWGCPGLRPCCGFI